MDRVDIVVSGAGPTGLMLATLAVRRGLSVIVLERDPAPRLSRVAIGISIPTLEILAAAGLRDAAVRQGVCVRRLVFHGPNGHSLGALGFAGLGSSVDFVLSLPQGQLAAVLEAALAERPEARIERGCEVTGFREEDGQIVIAARRAGRTVEVAGHYAVACDSGQSCLRQAAGIPFDGASYRDHFAMADYEDPTPWADEAHVFFTPRGSVESFPLPGGQRRFVLPGPAMAPGAAAAFLAAEVPSRSGVDLGGRDPSWTMTFGVRRYLARSYRAGRLLLAGDAAHLMSPIVGQNLNTGVADAELLSLCLERIIRCGESPARWFDFYERTRRRAAEAAAFRAWLMMRLGASGGRAWSAVRNRLARAALCTHVQRPLARLFSMVSIPGRNLSALAPTPAGPT